MENRSLSAWLSLYAPELKAHRTPVPLGLCQIPAGGSHREPRAQRLRHTDTALTDPTQTRPPKTNEATPRKG